MESFLLYDFVSSQQVVSSTYCGNKCVNGSCISNPLPANNTFSCSCAIGYTGTFCDTAVAAAATTVAAVKTTTKSAGACATVTCQNVISREYFNTI